MTEVYIGLRDWFAGRALEGLLAGPNAPRRSKSESGAEYATRLAEEAYLLADVLLQQRGKQAPSEPEIATEASAPIPAETRVQTGGAKSRSGTVRIQGNWRNPNKMEWGGAPTVDVNGRVERSCPTIPEKVYEVVEREIAKGGGEGITFLPDGSRIDWFVDR